MFVYQMYTIVYKLSTLFFFQGPKGAVVLQHNNTKTRVNMSNNSTISVRMFVQRHRANAAGKAPIFARIRIGSECTTIGTKLYVLPEHWALDKTIGTTKELKAINRLLEELRVKIFQTHTEMNRQGISISVDKLKLALQGKPYSNDCHYYIELFNLWLGEYHKQVGISTSQKTYERYEVVRDRLQEYIKKTTKLDDILLTDVTPMFISGFDAYNRTHYEIGNNHAMKQMQKLRTVYKWAIDNGWVHKNPFAAFKIRFEEVEREILSREEITRLMQKEFSTIRMEQVRDVFIFSCFTGLAHCDVLALTEDNLRTDDEGNVWLRTHRQKTETPVDVPLLEIPQMIIAKYKPKRKKLRGKLLPVVTNSCTNNYLKELGDVCGINKNLTFHMARHTFATTITLTNGVPIESVCKMLGHRNIRTTQLYAKVIHEKVANDMALLASKIGGEYTLPTKQKGQASA